ncbi:hypothetical protein EGJ22_15115 [Pseudomonas sp. p99-361]|nr:hypothetical protein HV87_07805 [Pseudomonas aeruginosa]QEQ86032.1 hypothetical protein F1602_01320 [Pseudomonas putida]RRV17174.1 hypothetical protein EGJ22_15115 [Pseudomonas sp. p99-361]
MCPFSCCLFWPLRGHARSHRSGTGFETCDVPVGAGVPAKRPEQESLVSGPDAGTACVARTGRGCR